MHFIRYITLSIVVLSLLTGCFRTLQGSSQSFNQNITDRCFSTEWPHEKSDLAADPAVAYGRLDNDMRYVIMKNDLPKNRVALHLNIQAGSIHEDEEERGYAHFLEHMLFNGSINFPPGTLVEYFQGLGMEFGADTNAHTSYDETVYKIILPENSIEELRKGLLVMSDYARGALLLEDEVERERGVILAEKLARDSVSYRMRVASLEKSLEGTIVPLRQPIGTDKTLKNASSLSLRKFYEKWYIPEKTVLVIVGDVEVSEVEPLLTEYFGNYESSGSYPECPDIGNIQSNGLRTFYYHEKDLGNVQVAINSYWNKEYVDDSFPLQVNELKEYAVTSILKNRLNKIAEKEIGLFSSPRVYSGTQLGEIGYAGISVKTSDEEWQKSLTVIENSLRQMLLFGVTESELIRVKKELSAYFDSQVATFTTRKSNSLAREIIWHINNNRVFQSPIQEKELYSPIVEALTTEDLDIAFAKIWSHKDRLIELTGNAAMDQSESDARIREVYLAAQKVKLLPYASSENNLFPYENLTDIAAIPSESVFLEDIDTEIHNFSNGVTVNLKKTDFNKNKIYINVEFGPGKQTEPMPGLAMLTESVVASSGSGKLTKSEIEEALAGTSVDYGFSVGESGFSLSGSSLSTESEILIRSLYTLFKDPAVREDVFANKKLKYEQMYQSMASSIRGAESLFVNRFLSGGNKLISRATWDEIETINTEDIKEWVLPYFSDAAPEISIVGDFNKEKILQLISRSFGSLEQRQKYLVSLEPAIFPFGHTEEFVIDSQLDQALLVMAWKTEGFKDIQSIRRFNILALILEDRIRIAIRERLGASYSPSVYNSSSRTIPEYGLIKAKMIIDPEQIDEVRDAVEEICQDLIVNGVTEEELQRVKEPLLTSLKDRVKTNKYWLWSVLQQSSIYPEQLQWPKSIFEDNISIKAAEMSGYAEKYLQPSGAAVAIIRPRK